VTLEDVVERRVLGRAHPPHGDTACYAAE
jgi:hypothetical protein